MQVKGIRKFKEKSGKGGLVREIKKSQGFLLKVVKKWKKNKFLAFTGKF